MLDSQQRLAELDALRGVAVLMVLVFHYTTRFGELFPQAASGLSFPLGAYGVHVFFIISGFVIIMTLDRSERPADFLVARFSRLYPSYWTAILVTTAVLWLCGGPLEAPTASQVAANLTMLHGFFKVPSVDGVYWTLEVELLFYAFALAVFCTGLLRRAHLPVLAWLLLSALYLSPFWPAQIASRPFAGLAARLLMLEFAPFFVIGIMFYRLYRGQGIPVWNYALIAAAWGLLLLTQPLTVTLLVAATCGILWKLVHGGFPALRFRPLVFAGTISYPLYLVHQKVGYALMLDLSKHGWGAATATAAAVAASLALATAMTFLIERPAMQAIRRKYKARKAQSRAIQYRRAAVS